MNPKDIRRELADVRNKVNSLVDSFDAMQMTSNQVHGPLDSLSASTATTVAPTQAMEGVPFITAVTEGISAFDPLKSSGDHSTITTTVTTQLPVTSTISQVNATTSASGSTSHLFLGQNGGSFLDSTGTTQPPPPPQVQVPQSQPQPQPQSQPQPQVQVPQAAPGQFAQQPTAPPPTSTPQPAPYSTYPQTSQQTGYPGSSAAGQYSYPSQSQYPASTGNQYPPQQPQTNTSYSPYGPGAPYQPPTGSSYAPPPQGGRGGYPPGPSRNSPYRVGY